MIFSQLYIPLFINIIALMHIQLLNTSISQRSMANTKEVSLAPQVNSIKSTSDLHLSFQKDKSLVDTTIDRTLPIKPNSSPKAKETERRYKHLNYDQIKKQYLTKVLINRAINTRISIKKMEEIPSSLFSQGPTFDIAQSLVMNSKISF